MTKLTSEDKTLYLHINPPMGIAFVSNSANFRTPCFQSSFVVYES